MSELDNPPPQQDPFSAPNVFGRFDDLVRVLHEREVTTRLLEQIFQNKQDSRRLNDAMWMGDLTMIEAVIVWWESGVRQEALKGYQSGAQIRLPALYELVKRFVDDAKSESFPREAGSFIRWVPVERIEELRQAVEGGLQP